MPTNPQQMSTGDLLRIAVLEFHQESAKRLHLVFFAAGLATIPNRLVRNPEWLQTGLLVVALLAGVTVGCLVANYFYLKRRPERLVLPNAFLQKHVALFDRVREVSGAGGYQPKVLSDLITHTNLR